MKHRKKVRGDYDRLGAFVFDVLVQEGLRERHRLLDIGCGPLRVGRFLIQYLGQGGYCGIDPDTATVLSALDAEVGAALDSTRQPRFHFGADFNAGFFGTQFDFILAHSLFIHLPLVEVERCLIAARETMTGASKMLFTFIPDDFDIAVDQTGWSDEHIRHSPDALRRIATRLDLTMTLLPYRRDYAQHQWARLTVA